MELGVPFPSDWKINTLSNYWSVIDCKHVTAKFVDNGYPLASIAEVQSIWVDLSHAKQTTHFFYTKLIEGNRKPEFGDLIFSRNATVGEVAQVGKWHPIFAMGQDVCLIRKKNPKYSSGYLQQLLKSGLIKKQLSDFMVGSTFKRVNIEQIRSFIISFPPLPEQTAIATVLSNTDQLIQAIQKKIDKKRLIKQGAMQELLRPKEGWENVFINDVININRGGSPRPIHDFITTSPDGVNWIKIGDTSPINKYIVSSKERIIKEGVANSREVKIGDFLLSNSMSFGRPYILKINGCIHDGWLVLQNYHESFNREFLYYSLMSKYVLNQYLSMASGSGVLNLNKELVKKVKLHRPATIDEQKHIATILSDMDSEIETLEK